MTKQMAGTRSTVTARTVIWAPAIALAFASAFSVMLVSNASAVSLTNRDAAAYDIEVMFKSVRRAHKLEPGKTMTGFCDSGCVVRLNGSKDNDYALEGTERVSIEGGFVYYDGEEIKRKEAGTKPEK